MAGRVANLGAAGQRRRAILGAVMLVIALGVAAGVVAAGAAAGWALVTGLPFWAAALGLIQARDKT
jgi:hypothetical protein